MRLSRALLEKRPRYESLFCASAHYEQRHKKVILQHGNARPNVAKFVKTYLESRKWEVLPHPPYSPDIAPSDYYLFRSMAHDLADQQFRSYGDIEKRLDSWIASEDEHFYRNGIRALPERLFQLTYCLRLFNLLIHMYIPIYTEWARVGCRIGNIIGSSLVY